jgi:hypothetical protein
MPCPSHPPWLDHSNYTWRALQVMKFLIMHFSPTSYHFIALRSKCSPQTPLMSESKYQHSCLENCWDAETLAPFSGGSCRFCVKLYWMASNIVCQSVLGLYRFLIPSLCWEVTEIHLWRLLKKRAMLCFLRVTSVNGCFYCTIASIQAISTKGWQPCNNRNGTA